MNQYTIYCTQEQAERAYNLGAPIDTHEDVSNTDGKLFILPTAEQMVGWMRKSGISVYIAPYYCYGMRLWTAKIQHYAGETTNISGPYADDRDAILKAIDYILDGLEKAKAYAKTNS